MLSWYFQTLSFETMKQSSFAKYTPNGAQNFFFFDWLHWLVYLINQRRGQTSAEADRVPHWTDRRWSRYGRLLEATRWRGIWHRRVFTGHRPLNTQKWSNCFASDTQLLLSSHGARKTEATFFPQRVEIKQIAGVGKIAKVCRYSTVAVVHKTRSTFYQKTRHVWQDALVTTTDQLQL